MNGRIILTLLAIFYNSAQTAHSVTEIREARSKEGVVETGCLPETYSLEFSDQPINIAMIDGDITTDAARTCNGHSMIDLGTDKLHSGKIRYYFNSQPSKKAGAYSLGYSSDGFNWKRYGVCSCGGACGGDLGPWGVLPQPPSYFDVDTKDLSFRYFDISTACFDTQIREVQFIASESKFSLLGCWKDRANGTNERAIPSLEGTHSILDRGYKPRNMAILKCMELASSLGYTVFAIQDGGQCLSSDTAKNTYKEHGSSLKCAEDGRGGPLANEVYEIKSDYVCDQNFMKQDGVVENLGTLILGPMDTNGIDGLDYCQEKCRKMRKCHSIQYCEGDTSCRLYYKKLNGQQKLNQTADPGCFSYNRTCDYAAKTDSLVGPWTSAVSANVWTCQKSRRSSTQLICSMPVGNLFVTHKLSFFRTLVTWEATGSYGRYDGHNTVTWKSGKWIRKGCVYATQQKNTMKCEDGTYCNIKTDPKRWGCCDIEHHGGRSQCPENKPIMCAKKICNDNTDYCCAYEEEHCKGEEYGGVRECE